jgi:hypothetical protein
LVADTVRTEDAPATIDVGFAVMFTVAAITGCTETVAVAVTFPEAEVANAV